MRFGFRELIFFAVLLAVPVASFMYVFKPRNDEIRKARDEIEVKQTRLQKLAEVTGKIDDLGLAVERGRQSIELIEAKLPSEKDVEGILEQIWQIGKANDLSLKSVKTDKHVPAAMYMELPLKMVMEGRFDGFYEFLLELESLPRITRIHEMNLVRLSHLRGPVADDSAPGTMRAEFTLSIYYESQLDFEESP